MREAEAQGLAARVRAESGLVTRVEVDAGVGEFCVAISVGPCDKSALLPGTHWVYDDEDWTWLRGRLGLPLTNDEQ